MDLLELSRKSASMGVRKYTLLGLQGHGLSWSLALPEFEQFMTQMSLPN